jgi:hypothetical protein
MKMKNSGIYKVNDTLTFTNQFGQSRFYYVKTINRDTITEMDKLRAKCDVNHLTRVTVDIWNIPDTLNNLIEPIGKIEYEKSSGGFYMTFNMENIWCYNVQDECKDTLLYQNKMVKNIGTFSLDSVSMKNDKWRKFIRIYYCRDFGIIRMDGKNGEIWELNKNK